MNDSILTTIKKMLGIQEEYEHFDTDIMIHINSIISNLTQVGVGPTEGFYITDKTQTWTDFLGDNIVEYSSVKSYVYMKVKLIFDPPSTSFVIEAYNKLINEFEWRMNFNSESKKEDVTVRR